MGKHVIISFSIAIVVAVPIIPIAIGIGISCQQHSKHGQITSASSKETIISQKINMMKTNESKTAKIIEQFNKAFIIRDEGLLKNIIAADCVMEGAMPPPDGSRVEGYNECYSFWEDMINTPDTQFKPEIISIMGEKATIQWRFYWGERLENSIRGVTLITVKDGKISEALGYVKGNLVS
jgi:hypothetical protein